MQAIKHWQPGAFILSLLCSALLFLTYFYSGTQLFWFALDRPIAYALNSLVTDNRTQQLIWSFGNLRVFDYVIALIMLAILLAYAFGSSHFSRSIRYAQCFVIVVLLVSLVSLSKNVIFGHFHNLSPSLVLEPFTHLSKEVTVWSGKVKDHSTTSFPGDHAMVVATFTYLLWTIAGWRYGLAASVAAVVAVLPRMVSGAHWFSDVFVGGLGVAFFIVPWVAFTPIAWWLSVGVAKPVSFLDKKAERQQHQ